MKNFLKFSSITFQGFEGLLEQARISFEQSSHIIFRLFRMTASSGDKNIERSSYKVLLNKKALVIRKNLKKRHFQLLFIIHKLIKLMLSFGFLDGAFSLCALLNYVVILTLQNTKSSSGTLVISNTFPALLSNPKRMDIISILQVSSKDHLFISRNFQFSLIFSFLPDDHPLPN